MKFFKVVVIEDLDKARQIINEKRQPFILRNFDFGPCLSKWSVEYLCDVVGKRAVRIHVSTVSDMDFVKKNFTYNTLAFDELIKRASQEVHSNFFHSEHEKYYLRSLGVDERKDIADIKKEYPDLSKDINYPPLFDDSKFFSSVFRISSARLRLWTHYDNLTGLGCIKTYLSRCTLYLNKIMDNILIQIRGRKRVILWPPSDVDCMYMIGDKSLVTNVDTPDLEKFPLFANARRHECELLPGDAIFIPALWFHNVITEEFSIGVNVFWKHLDDDLYDKKDVYGNKDLLPAKKAIDLVEKSLKELRSLPHDYRDFYTKRLIQTLKDSLKDPIVNESNK